MREGQPPGFVRRTCQGECEITKLNLVDKWPRKFVEPLCGGPWFVYLVYRLLVLIYFSLLLVNMCLEYKYGAKWLLYLTHWNKTFMVLNASLQFIFCTVHYAVVRVKAIPDDAVVYQNMPWYFKILWLLQNVTMTTAPLASITYWISLPDVGGGPLDLDGLTFHTITTFYILIEIIVTGIPVRLLHMVYPLVYVVIYILLTVIYYLCGGTDKTGQHNYIYKALDYGDSPIIATFSVTALVLATAVCHCVLFLIYKVKMACHCDEYWCCAHRYNEHSTETQVLCNR